MGRKLSDFFDDTSRGRPPREKGLEEREVKMIVETTVAEFIQPIINELKEIKGALDRIERKLEALDKTLKETRVNSSSSRGANRLPARDPEARKVVDALKREGFIYASESHAKLGISGFHLLNIARRLNLVVIDLGGDYCVMSREGYREFLQYLEKINSSDPEEAVGMMGRYGDLFTRLRRIGSVYFDSTTRSWKLLK